MLDFLFEREFPYYQMNYVEKKDGKWLLYLPGVGKENITVTEIGSTIKVSWKKDEDTFEKNFQKLGNGETKVEYIDGILYLFNTDSKLEPKKIEIKAA